MISRSHPVVRRFRALRRDRALRDRESVLVAEGIHVVSEALDEGASLEVAVAAPRLRATPEGRALWARLQTSGTPLHEAEDGTIEALQDARSPQPVVAVVRRRNTLLAEVLRGRGGEPLLVVTFGVQDPGNLGSLIRTADAAGATGLLATGAGVDLFHPRTVRASMGSLFRLPVVEAGLTEALDGASAAGLTIVGSAPRGGQAYDAVDWRSASALLLGGEGGGLPEEIGARLGARVSIPMAPGVESLSVGAAAAVILFAAARARRTERSP